jgi:hypothetical protein
MTLEAPVLRSLINNALRSGAGAGAARSGYGTRGRSAGYTSRGRSAGYTTRGRSAGGYPSARGGSLGSQLGGQVARTVLGRLTRGR